jgi:hypothetical protein
MMMAVESSGVSDYRVESLVRDLVRLAEENGIYDRSLDDSAKREEAWRWALQEFSLLCDYRHSLEGEGLLEFEPVFPEAWKAPLNYWLLPGISPSRKPVICTGCSCAT